MYQYTQPSKTQGICTTLIHTSMAHFFKFLLFVVVHVAVPGHVWSLSDRVGKSSPFYFGFSQPLFAVKAVDSNFFFVLRLTSVTVRHDIFLCHFYSCEFTEIFTFYCRWKSTKWDSWPAVFWRRQPSAVYVFELGSNFALRALFIHIQINFQTVIRSGSAGEVFCDSAEQHKADFMVMGCRGHGKLRRTVLGSVSSYTINHAHVPVTVVPHPLKRRVKETREVETWVETEANSLDWNCSSSQRQYYGEDMQFELSVLGLLSCKSK